MAAMRSKLFSYQTESGNDLAAGPALIVDAFLRVLDRKIDRLRSAEREKRVFEHSDLSDALQLDERTASRTATRGGGGTTSSI